MTANNSFIKIRIGKTRLLLPAPELLSIETVTQIKQPNQKNKTTVMIDVNDVELPVYTANDELQFGPYQDGDGSCCLCLDDGQHRFGVVCDEAELISPTSLTEYNLPGCMKSAQGPIKSITICDGTIFCNTDTASLFRLLQEISPI